MRNLIMKSSQWMELRRGRPSPGMWFEFGQWAIAFAAASTALFSSRILRQAGKASDCARHSRDDAAVHSPSQLPRLAQLAIATMLLPISMHALAEGFNGTVQRAAMESSAEQAVMGSGSDASVQQLHLTMVEAWDRAELENKVIMLVLGNDSCDRCALLARYMADPSLSQRIDKNFINLNVSTDLLSAAMSIQIDEQYLPAIILIESQGQFNGSLPSDNLMTFRPESYEPLYDWMENLLFYSDQVFAAYSGGAR